MVKVDSVKHWYLICPTCGWFAPFTSSQRPSYNPDKSRICSTCDTLLLWEGLEPSLARLVRELKDEDPHASYRSGNGWAGFTSKLALTAIIDPNDIGWWLR